MPRELANVEDLSLPAPPIPMPGDEVSWYNDSTPLKGTLIGHNPKCQPVIRTKFGNESFAYSFGQIRLDDPTRRVGPNWCRLPEGGKIFKATADDISKFDDILNQHMPPGPRYYELITEIWHRGFEVFLVGGTVRDVIAGKTSFDVDLVTTMPLKLMVPLIQSMYRYSPSISDNNGYVRIGGKPGTGDPFIDLKTFCKFQPGTNSARFSTEFEFDVGLRDFACNSIYYDPINKVFIDPTGRGVDDAINNRLFIVCNPDFRNDYHQATIVVRFFKFLCRGYGYCETTKLTLETNFLPKMAAMERTIKTRYIRTQVLSKHPSEKHEELLEDYRQKMEDFGAKNCWDMYFSPVVEELIPCK